MLLECKLKNKLYIVELPGCSDKVKSDGILFAEKVLLVFEDKLPILDKDEILIINIKKFISYFSFSDDVCSIIKDYAGDIII
jgi:hypothetical protein